MKGYLFTCARCGKNRFIPDATDDTKLPTRWIQPEPDKYICDHCMEVYAGMMKAFYTNANYGMRSADTIYKSIIEEVNANGPKQASEELEADKPADADDPFAAVLEQFERQGL